MNKKNTKIEWRGMQYCKRYYAYESGIAVGLIEKRVGDCFNANVDIFANNKWHHLNGSFTYLKDAKKWAEQKIKEVKKAKDLSTVQEKRVKKPEKQIKGKITGTS